jgi:hypothetical protein
MLRGIITYKWVCEDLENGIYKTKRWELSDKTIVENFKSPYVDLPYGWYVDLDKRLCYYYSMQFHTKEEVEHCMSFAKPPKYAVDAFVRYEYAIYEFESEDCSGLDYKTVREKMTCLCKEGTTENCKDEKSGIQIKKLNTCIPVNSKVSSYIKTTSEALPV